MGEMTAMARTDGMQLERPRNPHTAVAQTRYPRSLLSEASAISLISASASDLLDRVRCGAGRRRDIAYQPVNDDAARHQCRSGGITPIYVVIANGWPHPRMKERSCGDVRC